MKKLFTAVIGFSLLTAASLSAAQTNLVQSLRFNLTALFQGANVTNQNLVTYSTVPRKISNADIIPALGVSLGRTFSVNAKLLLITQLPDGDDDVVVQDGTNRVTVTGYFSIDRDDVRVAKGTTDLATGVERGTEYRNWSFRLKNKDNSPDLNLHFRVRGLTQSKFRTLLSSQDAIIGEAEEWISSVAGTADLDEKDAVVRGTVGASGRTLEVRN
jgi:hypothetical protein